MPVFAFDSCAKALDEHDISVFTPELHRSAAIVLFVPPI